MPDPRLIANTTVPARHPWPADCFIQGGADGIVLDRRPGGGSYRTAFVEAFPDTFIRGEGATVEAAEDAAWAKYQQHADCPDHEYEPRGYTNGAGFCRHCGRFASHVFTGEQLGQHCTVCGVGTTYGQSSPNAYWDAEQCRKINPDDVRVWHCETHTPFRAERAAYMARLRDAGPPTAEDLVAVLNALAGPDA